MATTLASKVVKARNLHRHVPTEAALRKIHSCDVQFKVSNFKNSKVISQISNDLNIQNIFRFLDPNDLNDAKHMVMIPKCFCLAQPLPFTIASAPTSQAKAIVGRLHPKMSSKLDWSWSARLCPSNIKRGLDLKKRRKNLIRGTNTLMLFFETSLGRRRNFNGSPTGRTLSRYQQNKMSSCQGP